MADRVRGGLFNALGSLDGLSVCDAFAGSGALGLEAVSRGASSVTFVENDPTACRTIEENIRTLSLTKRTHLIRASARAWLRTSKPMVFDIILCDPPYDALPKSDLEDLARYLGDDGIFVLSWPGNEALPVLPNLSIVRQKSYGDAQLAFYKR